MIEPTKLKMKAWKITRPESDWSLKIPLKGESNEVANGNGDMTKADLQDVCDQAQDLLSDVYQPESSREDLAAAIGDALDLLENSPTDDDADADDDDGDDAEG